MQTYRESNPSPSAQFLVAQILFDDHFSETTHPALQQGGPAKEAYWMKRIADSISAGISAFQSSDETIKPLVRTFLLHVRSLLSGFNQEDRNALSHQLTPLEELDLSPNAWENSKKTTLFSFYSFFDAARREVDLFRKAQEAFLIENRNETPALRAAFDQRFGIVPIK